MNEVQLVGRVAGEPQERELPSGDVLLTFRLVVERGRTPVREGVRAVTVDTLDCAVWTVGSRRVARGLSPGDVVRVEGALRRRFWRSPAGAASRCEVEVARVRRLARALPVARKGRAPAQGRPPAEEVAAEAAEAAEATLRQEKDQEQDEDQGPGAGPGPGSGHS